MAESDGSLKIQVDLDTKGFKIGAKDLEAAAKRTASKISDIGDQASCITQTTVQCSFRIK